MQFRKFPYIVSGRKHRKTSGGGNLLVRKEELEATVGPRVLSIQDENKEFSWHGQELV